ncbi:MULTISPECIES: hypothetical protein [Methylomonas]|uniref:hypothetical protein n=1 Tax=Methylomonas TaxID=416 RepID=UPI001231BA97|nr:hypothetical protein [Methylomonas rhizoryzae]
MKLTTLLLGSLTALPAFCSANGAVLVTEQFVIVIAEHCPEGEVSCTDVGYTGVNRKTGEAIALKGEAWVRMCADGITPCGHLGWQFKNGDFIYKVRETPPALTVERGGKNLLKQNAVWTDY